MAARYLLRFGLFGIAVTLLAPGAIVVARGLNAPPWVVPAIAVFVLWVYVRPYLAIRAQIKSRATLARGLGWSFAADSRAREFDGLRVRPFPVTGLSLAVDIATAPRRDMKTLVIEPHPYSKVGVRAEVVMATLRDRLPRLELVPRGLRQDVRQATDVSTESAEFNRRWAVATENMAYAHALLTPALQEFLLRPETPRERITIDAGWIYMWWPLHVQLDSKTMAARLNVTHQIRGFVPPAVWNEYGERTKALRMRGAGGVGQATPDVADVIARHEIERNPDYAAVASTERNHLGVLALALSTVLFLAPAALFFAYLARAAIRAREASNTAVVKVAMVASWIGTAIWVAAAVLIIINPAAFDDPNAPPDRTPPPADAPGDFAPPEPPELPDFAPPEPPDFGGPDLPEPPDFGSP